jgi:hypothetical protein
MNVLLGIQLPGLPRWDSNCGSLNLVVAGMTNNKDVTVIPTQLCSLNMAKTNYF